MKMLTVCALLCAMMALNEALSPPPTTLEPTTVPEYDHMGNDHMGYDHAGNDHMGYDHTGNDHMGGWEPYCPDGWTMFDIRCLLYVPEKMTWDQAEEKCLSDGGTLASVWNTEQADEIRKVMQSGGHEAEKIWVGGRYKPEGSSWHWADEWLIGPSFQFHDWCPGEHKHHCLQITFGESTDNSSGCLDDMECEAELPSVCSFIIM